MMKMQIKCISVGNLWHAIFHSSPPPCPELYSMGKHTVNTSCIFGYDIYVHVVFITLDWILIDVFSTNHYLIFETLLVLNCI